MKARLHFEQEAESMKVVFSEGLNGYVIYVKGLALLNMIDIRNLIMAKDRATDCLLYLADEQAGELANYLINLPDGTEIEEEITVELNIGQTGYVSQYEITIDKNLEFVTFLKMGDKKAYKVKHSSCECMSWRFCKGSPKTCKHTDMLHMMGIKLKAEPKKIVLTKDERREWTNAFRREKIKDKEEKDWIIRNSQQLVIDALATSMAEWHEYYLKVKEGTITFNSREED